MLFYFLSQQVMDGQLGCPVHIPGLLAALLVQLQQPGAGLGVEGRGQGSGRGRRLASCWAAAHSGKAGHSDRSRASSGPGGPSQGLL